MDTQKFDAIARNLASSTSRRSVIGGLFGGALAMAGLSRAAGAPASKVDICHYDADTGLFHMINVSSNSTDAHLAHGDVMGSDFSSQCYTDEVVGADGCSCGCAGDPVDWCHPYTERSASGCSCVCPVLTSEEPRCFWMETSSGMSCWTTNFADGLNQQQCESAGRFCNIDGGACYGWGTSTDNLEV